MSEDDANWQSTVAEAIRMGTHEHMSQIARAIDVMSAQIAVSESLSSMNSRLSVNESRVDSHAMAARLVTTVAAPLCAILLAMFGWYLARNQSAIDETGKALHEMQVTMVLMRTETMARDHEHDTAIQRLNAENDKKARP